MRDLKVVSEERAKLLNEQAADYTAAKAAPADEQQGIVERINKRAPDLAKLTDEYTEVKAFEDQQKQVEHDLSELRNTPANEVQFRGGGDAKPGERPEDTLDRRSLGQMVADSKEYKARAKGSSGVITIELEGVTIKSLEQAAEFAYKASIMAESTPNWATRPPRIPRVELTAQRRPVVADLVPSDDTVQNSILWMEETTFENNADTVAEGAQKPLSEVKYTERNTPVQKIATILAATDEQLDDVPQFRALIERRGTRMIVFVEEDQLLNGTGTPPDLLGFMNKSTTPSLARAATEDNADAILRAITDVNSVTGFADTSGVILHPLNWLAIRLVRTTTGEYIWGHPSEVGPQRVWGLPVVATPAMTANSGHLGDYQGYSHISRRMGLTVEMGYINTDFRDNVKRIRLEERLSLEIYRGTAFNILTNLNQAP